jgi:hypothetical protein
LVPFEAVRALQNMRPRNVILKMSSKGAVVLAEKVQVQGDGREVMGGDSGIG